MTLQGARELNCERRRRQKHLNHMSAPPTGGQVELPKVVKGSFSLCGVFCFVLCFGAECVEVKLNT